ncbi:MAG: glycosyltransferase family 2 protein [Lewinellaceae bacterium]|nr:glycosyltransferase family 2 protein [Lewinellaceae bacterium]
MHFFLRERLYSIINQTFQDLELIILDDASTDQSLEILAEYKNHPKVKHFIENPVNSGSPFIQWKKGIELAQGEYIWIAESDDYADLRFLEEAVPIFMEHAETGIVCVHSTLVNDQGKIIGNTAERLKLKNSIVEKTEDILVIIDGKTF